MSAAGRFEVGHRGMGCTHIARGSGKVAAPITENTVASFKAAREQVRSYHSCMLIHREHTTSSSMCKCLKTGRACFSVVFCSIQVLF